MRTSLFRFRELQHSFVIYTSSRVYRQYDRPCVSIFILQYPKLTHHTTICLSGEIQQRIVGRRPALPAVGFSNSTSKLGTLSIIHALTRRMDARCEYVYCFHSVFRYNYYIRPASAERNTVHLNVCGATRPRWFVLVHSDDDEVPSDTLSAYYLYYLYWRTYRRFRRWRG